MCQFLLLHNILYLTAGAVSGRSNPTSKEWWLCRRRRAERSYSTSKVRASGWEELPPAQGQGQWLRRATPRPRSGVFTGTGGPRGVTPRSRSGGVVVRRYLSSKVRSSGCALGWGKEIPHVQGKRNPSKMVGVARGQTQWNHNHRKLVNLITLRSQPSLTQWN